MGEGNHNVSYDTTGNNTIMSHLRVTENSKINSNPKKTKVIEQKNKTVMFSILILEMKLLKLLKKLKLLV